MYNKKINNFFIDLLNHEEESKVILLYSDEIMSCLMNLFSKSLSENCYPLQEEILNVLSMIASVIGDNFSNYYNVFMPGLKQLLMSLPMTTQKQVTIRTLTIECIGFLVSSIKNNTALFGEDLNLIMKFLIDLQNSAQITHDDPHHQAIISVYSQFSTCLQEQFAVFLPTIMGHVLKALDIHVDFHLQDETKVEEGVQNKKMAQAAFDLKMLGGKKILSVNTDALEIKINAANAVYAISKNVKKAFLPYVEETKNVISKYMDYKYSREIRKCCLKTIYNLVMACGTEEQVLQLFNHFLPLLLSESQNLIKTENCKFFLIHFYSFNLFLDEDLKILLKQINKILKFFKSPLITLNSVNELVNLNVSTLKLQEELKKRTMNEFEDEQEDCDDDQKEQFKGEYEDYNDLMQVVMEISGNLIKLYKENVENLLFNSVFPYYYKSLTTASSSDNELLYAICIFDDLLENCSETLYNKVFADVLTNFFKLFEITKNTDLLQSLVYGLGVCAKRTSLESFNQFYFPTTKVILIILKIFIYEFICL